MMPHPRRRRTYLGHYLGQHVGHRTSPLRRHTRVLRETDNLGRNLGQKAAPLDGAPALLSRPITDLGQTAAKKRALVQSNPSIDRIDPALRRYSDVNSLRRSANPSSVNDLRGRYA